MKTRLLASLFVIGLLLAAPVMAETVYVTDQLRLGLFAGEQASGQRLRMLASGDALEVVERRGNFARVTTADGVTGWVKAAFLVKDKPAALIVAETEAARLAAEARIEELRAEYADTDAVHTRLRESLEAANQSINALETELAGYRAAKRNVIHRLLNDPALLGLFGAATVLLFLLGIWLGGRRHERRMRQRFFGLSLGE